MKIIFFAEKGSDGTDMCGANLLNFASNLFDGSFEHTFSQAIMYVQISQNLYNI